MAPSLKKLIQAYYNWRQRLLPRLRHPRTLPLAKFKAQFFARPEHQWMQEDRTVLRLIDFLWDIFPIALRAQLPKELIFAYASGNLACSMACSAQRQIVLIFPNLIKILHTASPERGLAVIGHELAHLILQHHQRKISPWAAQLAADQLVIVMGLGEALQEVIADFAPPWQAQIRIEKIAAALNTKRSRQVASVNKATL